ncbi:helix-turn-helix transcriptional regulator [Proteus terrae]|uniref:helix-turn-helix domain-containing protein n=1 Tax=Proteus terrae TaxID=1574161 RepID=UPI0018C6D184|nr:helix-turn-helix transcriptional regulator [Proteus terrae]MBG5950292.1 helix-turn-helix transcriptional regulator [Proteus terrae]
MVPIRLRYARKRAKLTQARLGILAGIDINLARSRICQYELGVHRPTFEMVCKFAEILNLPECYFYTINDNLAEDIIEIYYDKYCN